MRTAVLIALIVSIAGCSGESSPTGPDGPLALTDVHRTLTSGITNQRIEVISRQARWAEVWDAITAPMSPKPPLPSVDFDNRLLVLAALGEQSDSCKNVRVDSVERRGGTLLITAAETRPPATCTCPPIVVQPVHVVSIPRAATDASFTWRTVILGSCTP